MARRRPTAWAAVCAAVACSTSNSSGSSNNAFPFNGPSCAYGSQPTSSGQQTSAACGQCVQSHCSSEAQCASSACADYYSCFCACALGNFACYGGCRSKLTASCDSCINTIIGCEGQNCGTECQPGASDAGGIAETPDGSATAGVCAKLATCCAAIINATARMMCTQVASQGDQMACQMELPAFQDAGICP